MIEKCQGLKLHVGLDDISLKTKYVKNYMAFTTYIHLKTLDLYVAILFVSDCALVSNLPVLDKMIGNSMI